MYCKLKHYVNRLDATYPEKKFVKSCEKSSNFLWNLKLEVYSKQTKSKMIEKAENNFIYSDIDNKPCHVNIILTSCEFILKLYWNDSTGENTIKSVVYSFDMTCN